MSRILIAALLTIIGLTLAAQAEPPTLPFAPTPTKKLSVDELRRQYPFVSLTERLGYEAARKLAEDGRAPGPELPPATAARLALKEKQQVSYARWEMRNKSLALLHSTEAEEFVKREGFGISRQPQPEVRLLALPAAPTIPFETPGKGAVAGGPGGAGEAGGAGEVGGAGEAGAPVKGGAPLPRRTLLDGLHQAGEATFLDPRGFGFFKSRDAVAGFEPHQFRGRPHADYAPGEERWLLTRVELVSLLKHAEPAVYLSDELPRMDALRRAPTRALSGFEAKALASLRKGEDLVVEEGDAGRIRMVGSLRATKACLTCHEVKRGDLLGAFSYDLARARPEKGPGK